MRHIDDALLQAIPVPTLVSLQGRVVCYNSAALSLFPDLTQDCPLPPTLSLCRDAAGIILVNGQNWSLTCSPFEDGSLLMLTSARTEVLSTDQLGGSVRCLREQLSQLLLSVQLIAAEDESISVRRLYEMNRTLCRMLRLVNHMDLLRTADTQYGSFRPYTLDLAGLLREVAQAAGPLLAQAEIRLDCICLPASLLVRGDSQLLELLLLELLSNAAQAAGSGAVTIALSFLDSQALITVTNAEEPSRSKPLAQLLAGTLPSAQIPLPQDGAGLGLALARHIVTLHNGTMLMERRKDRLTTTVSLPIAPPGNQLPVHQQETDYTGGLHPAVVALSEVLPDHVYCPEDLE